MSASTRSKHRHMNMELQIDFIVSGFVRTLESSQEPSIQIPSIPRPLVLLIMSYYLRKWTFVHGDRYSDAIVISEDGTTVSSKSVTYATIQFGEFFSNKDEMIYIFRIKFDCPAQDGIGFIGRDFNDFERKSWNFGGNDSILLCCNGYNPSSDTMIRKGESLPDSKQICTEKGDIALIKIDTRSMTATLWNRVKWDLSCADHEQDESNALYTFRLPLDKECAFVIDFGFLEQKMSVGSQLFLHQEAKVNKKVQ